MAMKSLCAIAALLAVALSPVVAARSFKRHLHQADGGEGCTTIAELAAQTESLSTLSGAVGRAPSIAGPAGDRNSTLTVLAPNNDAFAMLPEEPLQNLLNDTRALEFVLGVHIIPGALRSTNLTDGAMIATISGVNLTVSVTDGAVTFVAPGEGGTSATVLLADQEACNSVVHVIDTVLLPGGPSASEPAEDSNSTAMPAAARPVGSLPRMPLPGAATNATKPVAAAAASADLPQETSQGARCSTIGDIAAQEPALATLVAALGASPEIAAVAAAPTGGITVFAPINEAFALLPEAAIRKLLKDNAALDLILGTHIVPRRLTAADLTDGATLTTIAGTQLSVSLSNSTVTITAAGESGTKGTVAIPDVGACNGIVHVLDGLLVPGDSAATRSLPSCA